MASDGQDFVFRCTKLRQACRIRVARKLKTTDVIEALCELFTSRGMPSRIRSDNGPESVRHPIQPQRAHASLVADDEAGPD